MFRLEPKKKSASQEMAAQDAADYEVGRGLLKNLQYLLAMMLITQRSHVDPENFVVALPKAEFPQGEQQDVTLFVRYILLRGFFL